MPDDNFDGDLEIVDLFLEKEKSRVLDERAHFRLIQNTAVEIPEDVLVNQMQPFVRQTLVTQKLYTRVSGFLTHDKRRIVLARLKQFVVDCGDAHDFDFYDTP